MSPFLRALIIWWVLSIPAVRTARVELETDEAHPEWSRGVRFERWVLVVTKVNLALTTIVLALAIWFTLVALFVEPAGARMAVDSLSTVGVGLLALVYRGRVQAWWGSLRQILERPLPIPAGESEAIENNGGPRGVTAVEGPRAWAVVLAIAGATVVLFGIGACGCRKVDRRACDQGFAAWERSGGVDGTSRIRVMGRARSA